MPFLYAPHQIGRRKAPFKCEGGTETTVGNTKVHTFLSTGTFTVTSGEGQIDCLVVAGGGGNPNVSTNYGAGAGGMVVQNGVTVAKGAFTVTIGAGGNAHPDGSGTNSSIVDSSSNSITTNAVGGGGGSAFGANMHGGSGMGGLDGTVGEGTAGQGNDGGNGARSGEGA